ncbi:MAG: MBL fold metallo-hydrolase [Gammaproteobacteria bacterium]|nr:MBL fold metallo-hydrolase [Gammaproteobacteria bacterium]NNJ78653.1 MBL fold metallo-hydrolase [Xanthomonadales bacterium]
MLEIKSFHEPDSGSWTHLLTDSAQRVAALIDPVWVYDPVSGQADGSFANHVLEQAAGYRIEWILETHAHADHLTAAGWIREKTGARMACARKFRTVQENFARVFNLDIPPDGGPFDRLLDEGDRLTLGDLEIRVMATPGHTGDGLTYQVEDAAFIGDTLFAPKAGTGRCDFPGGDARQLYRSIRKLYELPRDTRLFLCHDYPDAGDEPVRMVTVEESMRHNIHVRENTSEEEFVALREGRDRQLGLPRLILPALQVNILGGAPPAADDNGVSYLRIPFNTSIAESIGGDNT